MLVSVLYSTKGFDPNACAEAGRAIANAGHDILIVPGKPSAIVAKAYKEAGGSRVTAFYPSEGEFGLEHVKEYEGIADDEVKDISWPEANCQITQRADAVVVLGIDVGTLIELGFIKYNYKWFKRPQKLILLDGIELPLVLEECFQEIGLPIDRVASASELFL